MKINKKRYFATMKRINRKDRVILEELESKYGTDAIAAVIIDAQDVPQGVVPSNMSPVEIILEYIKKIEGYRIRLREIHWEADHKSVHELSDSLMDDLLTYEDSIAEDMMGIIGYRIKVGTIVPKLPKSTELKTLISEIINDTMGVRKAIENMPLYFGIVSLMDECIHMLNKSQYLADFK